MRLFKIFSDFPISRATYFNWKKRLKKDERKGPKKLPENTTSPELRREIIKVCSEPKNCDLAPKVISINYLDKDEYLASASTIYRVLGEEKLINHRGSTRAPRKLIAPHLSARRPLEVLSWDITYLKNRSIRGLYFYLYLVMDIFSRKIIGWAVHDREAAEYSVKLISEICTNENIPPNSLTIHSDNGSPMRACTLLEKMKELKIKPSFIRPRVSNDNPFSESLNRQVKHSKNYPKDGFDSIDEAIYWVELFVDCYNNKHLHSGIKMTTPSQRHSGEDKAILERRKNILEKEKAKNPGKWIKGKIANFNQEEFVFINKKEQSLVKIKK